MKKGTGFHPGYGLPEEFRQRVIKFSDANGISAAAKKFNVARSSIYRWIAASRKRLGGDGD